MENLIAGLTELRIYNEKDTFIGFLDDFGNVLDPISLIVRPNTFACWTIVQGYRNLLYMNTAFLTDWIIRFLHLETRSWNLFWVDHVPNWSAPI
jgi:hypothetical protein